MTGENKRTIEEYLQEGLLAISPLYDNGDRALVLTKAGLHQEPRTFTWLVKMIASHYKLDLVGLRRYYRGFLKLSHHIPLPFSESLVLLPVKVREAVMPGETTVGLVSMQEIEAVLPQEDGTPFLATILFKSGEQLGIFNTAAKMRTRLEQGLKVQRDYLRRCKGANAICGVKREQVIEAVKEVLPNCECFMREFFLERFGLD